MCDSPSAVSNLHAGVDGGDVDIDGGVDLLISALERSGRLTNQTSQAKRFSGNLEFDWIAK